MSCSFIRLDDVLPKDSRLQPNERAGFKMPYERIMERHENRCDGGEGRFGGEVGMGLRKLRTVRLLQLLSK